jgi:hypothetical protein
MIGGKRFLLSAKTLKNIGLAFWKRLMLRFMAAIIKLCLESVIRYWLSFQVVSRLKLNFKNTKKIITLCGTS